MKDDLCLENLFSSNYWILFELGDANTLFLFQIQMTLEGDLLEEYLKRVEKRNKRTLYVKVPSPVDMNNATILNPLFDDAASTRFPQHKTYVFFVIIFY